MFELKDLSGVEESRDVKPILENLDIVVVQQNYDTSDSDWQDGPSLNNNF